MNILVLDDDEVLWQGIEHIKEIKPEWYFLSFKLMKNKKYNFDKINLVLVDTSIKEYYNIYKEIIKEDSQKKVVVISDSLKSCTLEDCESCMKNNQIRRLMKPIELNRLYKMIDAFEEKCLFYNVLENVSVLLEIIIKRFSSLKYDGSLNEVSVDMESPSITHTQELLAFVNILEQNNIEYTILNEAKIKIN